MPARKQKNKKKNHHHNNNHGSNRSKNPSSSSNTTTLEMPEQEAVQSSLPYQIENSEIVGRYLVASRDLKPGEILITEKPLAIGPCVSADPVCLGCYKPVELHASQYRCSECLWPMCGPKCRGLHQSDGHTLQECLLLKEQKPSSAELCPKTSATIIKNLYELILIIRILLMKQHSPEKYKTIMVMECHTEMRKKNTVLWQHYQRNVVDCLRERWQLSEYTEEQIHTVCGIVDVNCFEIGQNSAKARTLYPSAFLLAHDCKPNTSHTDDPYTYSIILRTSTRVPKGVALTLSYAYTLQGTLKRRDFMHAGKLFWCSCQRCEDPKELGTDCSAIACAKCKNGSIRSSDPLNQGADWGCDSCQFKLSGKDVERLLDKINNDLEIIDVHDVCGLENFLKRYQAVLRPNHYLLLSAKYSLCQIVGRIEGYLIPDMSLEDLKRKERYCREFLEVVDVLEPGLTRLRGLIMYELHAPILVAAQRLHRDNLINRQDFMRQVKEVIKLLKESRDIMKLEPVGSPEYQMGVAAADALEKLGCL